MVNGADHATAVFTDRMRDPTITDSYWTDADTKTIGKVPISGGSASTIASSSGSPGDIAVPQRLCG